MKSDLQRLDISTISLLQIPGRREGQLQGDERHETGTRECFKALISWKRWFPGNTQIENSRNNHVIWKHTYSLISQLP